MNPKERILTLLSGKVPDRVPFAHCERHLPRGEKERLARNMGMGLLCYRPAHVESMLNVEIVTRSEPNKLIKTYRTPLGELTEVISHGIGYGAALFGRDWKGVQPIRTQFLVKEPNDYKVLKYIVENISYKPYYYPVEDQIERLGNDGIVITTMPYEPMQRLLVEWVGPRIFVDLLKSREQVEEVYYALEKKYEEELFPIVANSPSEVVLYLGNIDSILVNPSLFEKYYLPTYKRCSDVLHSKDKLLDVHMDGKLRPISKLISKAEIDIIEAFTPPPVGDYPIDEALSLWKDKIIWINFPSAISTALGPRPKVVKQYLLEQLKRTLPSTRVMFIASTENFVPEDNMMAMAEIMEKAELPLTEDLLLRIQNNI